VVSEDLTAVPQAPGDPPPGQAGDIRKPRHSGFPAATRQILARRGKGKEPASQSAEDPARSSRSCSNDVASEDSKVSNSIGRSEAPSRSSASLKSLPFRWADERLRAPCTCLSVAQSGFPDALRPWSCRLADGLATSHVRLWAGLHHESWCGRSMSQLTGIVHGRSVLRRCRALPVQPAGRRCCAVRCPGDRAVLVRPSARSGVRSRRPCALSTTARMGGFRSLGLSGVLGSVDPLVSGRWLRGHERAPLVFGPLSHRVLDRDGPIEKP
jgi:hypothetical protein